MLALRSGRYRKYAGGRADLIYNFIDSANITQAVIRGGLPITFARTGTATYWDNAGVLQTAAENVARFDHNPADNTRRGLLIEEARTNVCLQNRTFDTTWTQVGTPSPTANAVGITGVSNTAFTLTDNDVASAEQIYQDVTIPDDGNTHAAFVFVKKDSTTTRFPTVALSVIGGTALQEFFQFNTLTGVGQNPDSGLDEGSSEIRSVGNWWQIILKIANNSTGNTTLRFEIIPARGTAIGAYNAAAVGSIICDWAQVELNVGTGDVSSPIGPTTTGSVTRNAETAMVDVSSLTLNPFSVYAAYTCGTTEDGTICEIGDGTANERIVFSSRPSTGNTGLDVTDGGAAQVALTANPDPAFGTSYKLASRLQTNLFAFYTDAANGTDTSGTMPTVTTLYLGGIYGGTVVLNGWLREVKVWTYALDVTRLAALVA